MGEIIMSNWDIREFHVQVNWQFPIWQVQVLIRRGISPISSLPNSMRQVIPLTSHMHSYPLHHSHLHPPSLPFSSTTQPLSQNTKLPYPSLSLRTIIMSWHQVWNMSRTAFTKHSIPRIQHTPSTAYTNYSIHRVQHTPKSVPLPFILRIRNWPLEVASDSGVPPYMFDCH